MSTAIDRVRWMLGKATTPGATLELSPETVQALVDENQRLLDKLRELVARWRQDAARFDDDPPNDDDGWTDDTNEAEADALTECADELEAVIQAASVAGHPP